MPIPFNEAKATQAAAYLLKRRGGRMHYLKLIKLLYFADRAMLLRYGRSITTDRFVMMDRGPVLSRILNLATDERGPDTGNVWAKAISEPLHYQVALIGDPGDSELSEAETTVLEATFDLYGYQNRWKLVDIAHGLPEWVDPHGGAIPREYTEVLAAAGASREMIDAVEQDLAQLQQMHLLTS